MSRKHFVKLVMSCGHDRNFANGYATAAIEIYGSYQSAWEKSYVLNTIKHCNDIANDIFKNGRSALNRAWRRLNCIRCQRRAK